MKKLFYKIFKRYKRLELKFCSWDEGDRLIKANQFGIEEEQWHIANEEDNNKSIGWVWLERKKRITG